MSFTVKSESLRPATTALLLAISVLCAAVLSVLTLSTAAADRRLAEKYAATVQAEYTLEGEAAVWLASVETQLSNGTLADGTVKKTIGDPQGRHLEIELSVKQNTYTVTAWRLVAPEADSGMENLWK